MAKGGRYLAPLRVLQTATRMLESGYISKEPVWFRTVADIPPTTTIVRTRPVQLQKKPTKLKGNRKIPGMFKPDKIVYPEDAMRTQFFKDHPWELARPRVLVENDGRDYQRYDWSKIQQRGKALDGERCALSTLCVFRNGMLTRSQCGSAATVAYGE